MEELAKRMNEELGLAGEEAYRVEEEVITDSWHYNPQAARLTSIPEGPMRKDDWASSEALHSWRSVPMLRLRLVRSVSAEESGEPLVRKLREKKPADDRFEEGLKIWDEWRRTEFCRYPHYFKREFIRRGLELDIREGAIGPDGRQAGRAELGAVLKRFDEATEPADARKALRDPLRVIDAVHKNAGVGRLPTTCPDRQEPLVDQITVRQKPRAGQ
jgi:hypothetical protein